MQTTLVLTLLGNDRPGLVKSLSEVVKNHYGNWQESRMVQMNGQFAGLAQVSVDPEHAEILSKALQDLEGDDLQILIKQSSDDRAPAKTLSIELLGPDRHGIIHDITHHLSEMNVNIEKLSSEQRTAPMSNEVLFFAEMILGLPEDVAAEDIQDIFEALSDSLMVDINFSG